MSVVLTETQIRAIEASNADGLTSQQIVGVFEEHDVKFSEATLRKYVQLGLVPRSRRVGQKGKHLGSHGIYPVRAVRRINAIKKLMAERYTIEEIQVRFFAFKDSIESLDEALTELLRLFQSKIDGEPPSARRDRLSAELRSIRGTADQLLDGVNRLEKLVISVGETSRPRGGGAVSPTELL